MSDVFMGGPGLAPIVTLGGNEYYTKAGTFKETPREKSITEKRSLTNTRRRQVSWDPMTWEFTIATCSNADKAALQTLYYSETYSSYVFTFSYHFDFLAKSCCIGGEGTEYMATHSVTIDGFDPQMVMDNPERWDIEIKLTEWM